MSAPDEATLRGAIIAACRDMNAAGVNHGTSGNISVRFGDRMLITPSATAYAAMTPDMIASMPLEGGGADGPLKPSTEWPFHLALYRARPDIGAIVHAHPTFATALSICRRPIPPVHYMIAAFGGDSVSVADYALFGSTALAEAVVRAMRDRFACLMANHGALAAGDSLATALWRMIELETLARQYGEALRIGEPVLLSQPEMTAALERIRGYGRPGG